MRWRRIENLLKYVFEKVSRQISLFTVQIVQKFKETAGDPLN